MLPEGAVANFEPETINNTIHQNNLQLNENT